MITLKDRVRNPITIVNLDTRVLWDRHIKDFIKDLKKDLKEYWDSDGCFVLAGVTERIDKFSGFALHENQETQTQETQGSNSADGELGIDVNSSLPETTHYVKQKDGEVKHGN